MRPRGRLRALSAFDRAILKAPTFRETIEGEDLRGVLIPNEYASGFSAGFETGHSRRVEGAGTWFVAGQETLATMILDTIDGLDRGGAEESETFRRRIMILRRLLTEEEWEEAIQVRDDVRRLLDPGLAPVD